jgi:hypothetical protein
MPDLKDLKYWWAALTYVGGLIAAASIVPKSTLGFVAGLSLLFFGVGEWMNRPRKPVKQTVEGLVGFKIIDSHPWQPTFLGIIFDAIGVGLFAVFAYLVWMVARQIS